MAVHSVGTAKQNNMSIWRRIVSPAWRTMMVGSEDGDNILGLGMIVSFHH